MCVCMRVIRFCKLTRDRFEVGVDVSLMVAIDGARHTRGRLREHDVQRGYDKHIYILSLSIYLSFNYSFFHQTLRMHKRPALSLPRTSLPYTKSPLVGCIVGL